MGDVVQALPVACALRRARPGARITWAVEGWLAPLVAGHTAIDRVVAFPRLAGGRLSASWPRELRRAVAELRREPYDVALDLQGLLKSSLVALLSGAARRLGVPPQREGSRLVSTAVARDGAGHAVQRYLAGARALGAAGEEVRFEVPIRADAAARVQQVLANLPLDPGRPLVALAPSSSRRAKDWPAARWQELVARLHESANLLLIGAGEHRQRHRPLAEASGGRVHDFTGATSLAELAALLARCDLFIAADSGPLHLAAALGRPVLGLYGPTDPQRHGPYGQPHAALAHRALCAPGCGPRRCLRQSACLHAISVEEVLEKIR